MSEHTYDYFGIAEMPSNILDSSIMTMYRQDNYMAIRVCIPAVFQDETTTENTEGKGIHLGLMIDVSDSMSNGRLDAVKKTLHAARNSFQQNDYVTLVVFGETGHAVVVNHRMNDTGKIAFYTALDAVQTGGCTNMGAGFEVLNTVQPIDNRYDSVIILTDGEVNLGIESTEGLTAMACSIGDDKGLTYNMLGYGADHNRRLLRVLSMQTCGVYQYIQSDEQVSSSFGDIIGNTRATVIRHAKLYLSTNPTNPTNQTIWKCMEGSPSLGDLVPGREYWAIYQLANESQSQTQTVQAPVVRLEGWTQNGSISISKNSISMSDPMNIKVQILRARVSCALTDLSNVLESRRVIRRRNMIDRIDAARYNLEELQEELNGISPHSELWRNPLILHMKAQIADALSPASSEDMEDSLARLSAGAAAMSTQRAVSDPQNVDTVLFTSPAGRSASSRVHERYHR